VARSAAAAVRAEQSLHAAAVARSAAGVLPGSVQDFVINIGDRIYFDTDEYVVRATTLQPVLAAQAQWLSRYPAVRVRIEGNADERGTREYNLALGARRANAVRDFLVSQGVSRPRIETLSFGKERPIDAGSSKTPGPRTVTPARPSPTARAKTR
jgi:peptidoglycan-associated lipoprotein